MANDQKPVISVRKLRKVYMMGQEHVVALHNIDLDIPRGEVCCIFGTSGSGKSTLLNQLAGLEKPTRGVVRIGGVPISQLNEISSPPSGRSTSASSSSPTTCCRS